jgi:hypothetical protein
MHQFPRELLQRGQHGTDSKYSYNGEKYFCKLLDHTMYYIKTAKNQKVSSGNSSAKIIILWAARAHFTQKIFPMKLCVKEKYG